MGKIAIVTDSNSGITQQQAKELGVYIIPMPVLVEEKIYYEGIDIHRKEFYEKLSEGMNVSTSQPSPNHIIKLWKELLESYEAIVYIPMSSSFSGSCNTAAMISSEFDGRVQVVDNQRLSVTQRQSVLDALEMADKGIVPVEIKEILEEDKGNASIYIAVDTLEYLKKGGRINSTTAAVGTMLKIKPILQVTNEKIESFSKTRTMKKAKKIMIAALNNDMENGFAGRGKEDEFLLQIAHTNMEKEAEALKEELKKAWPGSSIYVDHLPLSLACHIGPGGLGVGCIKKLKIQSFTYEENYLKDVVHL